MEGNRIIRFETDYKTLMEVLMSNAYYRGERLKSADSGLSMVQASVDDDDMLKDVMLSAENDVIAMLTGRLGRVAQVVRNAPRSIVVNGVECVRRPDRDRDGKFAWGNYFTETEFPGENAVVLGGDMLPLEEGKITLGKKGTVIEVAAMSNFASELSLNVVIGDYVAERMLAGWLEAVYPNEAGVVLAKANEKMVAAERIATEREKPKRKELWM
jgi:hypothetical protein